MLEYIEFIKSNLAKKHKIDNNPKTWEIINNLVYTHSCINNIQKALFIDKKIIITSGFRSVLLNKICKGSLSSQHCKGQAIDFVVKDLNPQEVCKIIKNSIYSYDQLILEPTWVHISFESIPFLERKQNLIKTKFGYKKVLDF